MDIMTQWLLIHEDKRLERLMKTERYKKMMAFKKAIPWEELFRKDLESLWVKERKGPQGRSHYDSVKMFQILILQSLYNFSDERMEEELIGNLLFQVFLDIGCDEPIPDCNTIVNFRNGLQEKGLLEKLFNRFGEYLNTHGFQMEKGQIVDATIVEVPRQRNTREENEYIKENGKLPEQWSENKKNHKDNDATWAKKNDETHYGYKNSVDVDVEHKFIRKFKVTTASVHDSQVCPDIIQPDPQGGAFYADSAYHSSAITAKLEAEGLEPKICSKAVVTKS